MEICARVYRPRRARESPLFRLVEQHLEKFLRVYSERFLACHGPLRPDAAAKEKPQPVEFVEEARLAKDDFGKWRVSYNYDERGPIWRLGQPEAARATR